MARGLDELIEYLLEEIALGGETGLVQQFYQRETDDRKAHRHSDSKDINYGSDNLPTKSAVNFSIDRLFLSRIWTWLGRHSDVSIGGNKEYNNKSLDDVEKAYPGYTSTNSGDVVAHPPTSAANTIPDSDHVHSTDIAQSVAQEPHGPRIFVNKTRMYIAICGHVPDATRVFPSEWVLLQCIAVSRKAGILQGDLVRASGQDKRSVPKRTDALNEKGYIVKQTLYMKGNKTSRLYLRRFADVPSSNDKTTATVTDHLTVAHVARQIFDILKTNPLIPQEDLGDVLGLTRPGRARILLQLIRYFGRIGCLKRVKTAFGPSARAQDLRVCIQFLREPSDEEWTAQDVHDIDFNQPVEILALLYEAEAGQSEADHVLGSTEQTNILATEDDVTGDTRLFIPKWNPDRILANVLLEAAREAGLNGISNANARNTITGPFIKRTIESLFVKLSIRSLQAQPLGLRHLAILRSQELLNGILQYVHHALDAFAEKVRVGQGKWSNVLGGEQFQKELLRTGRSISDILSNTEVDQFGFHTRRRPALQVHNGEATVSRLIRDANVQDIEPRPGEPSLEEVEGGLLELVFHSIPVAPQAAQSPAKHRAQKPHKPSLSQPVRRGTDLGIEAETEVMRSATMPETKYDKSDVASTVNKGPRGRPRKFARGTERYWKDVFLFMKREKHPAHLKSRGKSRITTDRDIQQVFRGRPQGFDDIVVQAIELGLPVAATVNDISQQWMDNITAVMYRSRPGIYITPVGYNVESRERHSQILILKSSRLKELDWSNRTKCWPWQLLVSSAPHSFRLTGFPPIPVSVVETASSHVQRLHKQPEQGPGRRSTMTGPARGVFLDESVLRDDRLINQTFESQQSLSPLLNFTVGELTDATESDTETFDKSSTAANKRAHIDVQSPSHGSFHSTASNPSTSVEQESTLLVSPGVKKQSAGQRRRTKSTAKAIDPWRLPKTNTAMVVNEAHGVAREHNQPVTSSLPPGEQPTQPRQDDSAVCNDDHPSQNSGKNDNQESHRINAAIERAETLSTVLRSHETGLQTSARLQNVECVLTTADANHSASELNPEMGFIHDLQIAASDELAPTHNTDPANRVEVPPVLPNVADLEPEHPTSYDQKLSTTLTEQVECVTLPKAPTLHKKRPRAGSEDSQLAPESEDRTLETPAPKRLKKDGTYEATRPEVSKLCRIMVLELIGLCPIAPNVPWTFRRAMVPRWREANISIEQLSAKTIRAAIKALCESGKLKQVTFAFRGKSGTMVKMSVLGLRGIDATNPAVLDLQKKMVETEPADYVPPELEAEGHRAPNDFNRKRYAKELEGSTSQDLPAKQSKTPRSARRQDRPRRKDLEESTPEPFLDVLPRPINPAIDPVLQEPEQTITLNTGFLTLRVPRLRELNLPADNQLRYSLPTITTSVTRPRLDATEPLTADPRSTAARHNRRTTQPFSSASRLIWRSTGTFKLPSCLDEVPNIDVVRERAKLDYSRVSSYALFEKEVNCVATWEEKSADVYADTKAESPIFINHVCPIDASDFDQDFDIITFETPLEFPTATQNADQTAFSDVESAPVAPVRRESSRPVRKQKKRKASLDDIADSEGHETQGSKKRQRREKDTRPRRTLSTLDAEKVGLAPVELPNKRHRLTHLLRHMTEEEKYEIVVAVIIVRTLTGGIEKYLLWPFVYRLLPGREEQIIKDAWKTMSNRYRGDITEVTESLQHRYLEAFAAGEVPTVNFDDLESTRWEEIYSWGLKNLDKSIVKRTEELPATRAELLQRNDYTFNEPRSTRDLLCYNAPSTVPRKEEILSATVFGEPLQASGSGPDPLKSVILAEVEEKDKELSRAKSWVLATLLSPEDRLDTTKTHGKLLTLASSLRRVENLLEKAMKSLQRDKIVSVSHRILNIGSQSQPTRQRNRDANEFHHLRKYEVSARFFEQFDFRRLVTTTMLKRAAKYKLDVLDTAFKQPQRTLTLAKDTALNDGEMVALMNLLSMGMIRIKPGHDVPASRWGLEWEKHGYTTRMIDKKVLAFSVVVSPVKYAYVHDDPLAIRRSNATIPRGEIDHPDGRGRIPIWFDILHQFHAGLWEMVLGAVLGIVSIRPGVDVLEIVRTLSHGVSPGEVEMVLRWAERAELVQRTPRGKGWETRPWWWMGVGVGEGWKVDDRVVRSSAEEATVRTEEISAPVA